jgi:methyl-accepting chemotaxis protein
MKTSNHLLRRLTAALLAAVLALSIALPVFASDDGDTIYINSVSDLLSLARNCAYDQWSVGKTVILQKDLSLEGMLWEPIPSFSGQFKGNGHTISDLTITGQYSPAGLFGIVEEQGSIESLSVRGVVSVSDSADTTTGGIVGINHGTLINCQFTGVVTGDSEVGGIVGRNESEGTIDHGTARAIVTGKSSTGGIAGYNLGAITGCTNVGSINTEYPEASLDTDGFTAKMVDYINNKMAAADNDATNSVTNVATDTGGIAGRSSGMILTSVNTGTIGYEHVGYNVGGIVGRTDGLVSGCVNQGRVLGRKDVGGIAGQAEPYRELDLSKDTIKRLRSELEVLRGLVDDTTGVVENSTTSISNSFSAMTSQMDTAIAAARQLDDQASDYGDEVADEIDRASTLLADTLTKLEPVMDTGEDAMTKLTDATGNLKWAMREMAAEMLMASRALAKTSDGLDKVSDAAEDGRDGMSAISEGIKQLLESVDTGDDSAASQAISTILTGYDSLSSDKKSDKNLKTGIELLKVANSVASVFTLGSGMAPAMKAVTAGMGLLRTASLLSNDSDIARATSQIASAIGTISTIATQMGGIVGSAAKAVSASDHPELAAALTKTSDALDDMGGITDGIMDNIKDWVGNNGGGSIKDGLDQLSDASDKLSDAMDDLSDSLDLLKTDAALTSATLAHTSVALGQMQDGLGGLTDMMGQTRDILHWLNQQDPIKVPRPSAELTNTKDSLFDAVSAINDKMDDINSTMRTASNQLTDKMRAVTAQVSVVSNLMLDAVEEISDPGSKTIYEDESEDLIASQSDGKIENSINRGSIDADMNVGGIAGTMGVENLLDPEEDNKDEGTSLLRTSYTVSAVLIGNINEGSITAKKDMVGGIVGQGTDSDLTDGSLIAINNRAIVSVLEGQQYVGAVSGGQDGGFYGNLFVSDDLQGIDRLSRVGQAEPVTYETLLAQENVPDSFRKLTLTFKADGHIIKKISFDYGASFTLDDYPEIPQKNGYYAEWSTPVLDQLHTDTVVNVEYTPYIPSLSSSVTRENGRPVFFVDGFFGGSNAVQVTQQDITADVHGVTEQWLLEFTDDGNETHQIRYLTPGKAKGKVYVKQADGSWHKVETGSFGSYTTFTTTGTEVEVAFVPAKLPVWAFCAGGAALLVLLLLLAKRIKSKRGPKGEKPRREKKGRQPETADAPADELDTPISETDMQ